MILYLVTNTINGKRYIGKTKNLIDRWRRHKTAKSCTALRNAIDKYGVCNFSVEMIGEIPNSFINEFESEYINRYNTKAPNGYNLTDGGDGQIGFHHSESTRAVLSQKLKGNRCASGSIRTQEMRKRASEITSKSMTVERREFLRQTRLHQVCPRTGKTHSEDSKRRMSLAHSNISDVTREKMRVAAKLRCQNRKA